jgi:DNA replication and repair protein RecF
MYVSQIELVNYRNFEASRFELKPGINCIVGPNGIGKTTLLDAVYHLCFGKSYFNPLSTQNIRFGEGYFMLDGRLIKEGQNERIQCSFKKGHKKVLKRNGKEYERIRDHIGLFPAVIVSPSDRDLISEGSDVRRKLMDGIISQTSPAYLDQLIRYNRILEQRNALLKYFALNQLFDENNLRVYDEQLCELGSDIYRQREEFIEGFRPLLLEHYRLISENREEVDCTFVSQLQGGRLRDLLLEQQNRDLRVQYTTQGIHKDDLQFLISGHPIKKYGSQGQQKTFLIALKLAQWEYIRTALKTAPVLLLDDIFDKLDEKRVSRLIHTVGSRAYEQVILSDTHPERTREVVENAETPYHFISVEP